ncbi:MAG: hypothetical protein EOO38_15035 [Cytophagaceae bacterium]|nr:MAG: hypothetical protein EOO38_15035 [Cytophagaceae bacterium]
MISNRASYDAIVRQLRVDVIQSVYVPELKRYAEVIFIQDKLYIAEGVKEQRIWHPVERGSLVSAPVPGLPQKNLHGYASVNPLMFTSVDNQTPPPPYTAGPYWTAELAVTSVETAATGHPVSYPPAIGTEKLMVQQPNLRHPEIYPVHLATGPVVYSHTLDLGPTSGRRQPQRVHPKFGTAVPFNWPGAIARGVFAGRQLVDPVTGAPAHAGTLNPVTRKHFRSAKYFDAVTGLPAKRTTAGAVILNTLKSQRLVDPVTGIDATDATQKPIPRSVFLSRRFVDPLTGTVVQEGTPKAVRYYVFRKRGYIDPTTGDRVTKRTSGSIPAAAYDEMLRQMVFDIQLK